VTPDEHIAEAERWNSHAVALADQIAAGKPFLHEGDLPMSEKVGVIDLIDSMTTTATRAAAIGQNHALLAIAKALTFVPKVVIPATVPPGPLCACEEPLPAIADDQPRPADAWIRCLRCRGVFR
jgi:hypothetical protein